MGFRRFSLLVGFLLFGFEIVRAAEPYRHVVFDLDWTLIAEMEPDQVADPSRVVEIEGVRYRVAEHAEEVIRELADDPRVKVSFFSGGQRSRNIEVLKALKLGDGRSAHDIAYRVLSKEDLTQKVKDPEKKLPFPKRWGKDISKIDPDLEGVVLVDDILNFVLRKQRHNQLWLANTKTDFDTYEEAVRARSAAKDTRWIPSDPEEFFVNRYKLPGALAIIKESLDEEKVQELSADPRNPMPRKYFSRLVDRKQAEARMPFIEKGLRMLGRYDLLEQWGSGRCTVRRIGMELVK